jgi:hypothetical protein
MRGILNQPAPAAIGLDSDAIVSAIAAKSLTRIARTPPSVPLPIDIPWPLQK